MSISREKFKNGGAALEKNKDLPENVGGHWRYHYNILKNGNFEEHYNKNVASRDKFEENLKSGRFVVEDRLVEFLATLSTSQSKQNLAIGRSKIEQLIIM